MNKMLLALAIVLLVGATASAQYYVPQGVTAYYPPTYAAPAPYYAPAPVAYSAYYAPAPVAYSAYYAPTVVVARPRVAYMPVVAAAPAPVIVGRPAVIRTKVYYPGYPIRNTVRYVLP